MKKLLLVDDDRDFLQILSSILAKDFEVYKADGVSQALKIFDAVPISAICSDYNLRDGTGIDLLKKVCCENVKIPFLLMSGSDDTRLADTVKKYDALFLDGELLKKIISSLGRFMPIYQN